MLSNALRASSDRDTHSDFLLAPSPATCSFSGLGNFDKAFYELSVLTYKAKESPNLCVSLWWFIFSNGLYIGVARPNTSL